MCVCVCGYLALARCGELGLEGLSSLLAVSILEALLWSCLPAEARGLLTAPRTLAALGWEKTGGKGG